MGKRLVRTDKNGTQHWVDDRCPKCGGTGYIQCYAYHDGGIRYQCGGYGYRQTSWQAYTPEHQAKLDERRRLKAEQDKAKFEENIAEYRKELGLAENGLCYIVMAKTFGKTDELKAAGGRYNGSWWYLDHPDADWDTEEYDPKGLLVMDYRKKELKWDRDPDEKGTFKFVTDDIWAARRKAGNLATHSEFYGSVGDKVNLEVTLERTFSFDSTDWMGRAVTKYGYKMTDGDGHHFIWITESNQDQMLAHLATGSPVGVDSSRMKDVLHGLRVILKGRVKGHQEREGLNETTLTRCSIKPVVVKTEEEWEAEQAAQNPPGTDTVKALDSIPSIC